MAADAMPMEIARQDMCRFLAACYYEPSPDFVEADLFGSIIRAAEALSPDLAECASRLEKAFTAVDLQTLLVDHTRLFMGPSRPLAMPYGSFWLSGDAAMQAASFAVQALYEEGGFELDEEFRDLPDHIAVELEFLYVLLFAQHQAISDGDEKKAAVVKDLRQRLLQEHLGKWVIPFAAAVRENAETAFHCELADLTEQFIRAEIEQCEL